MQPRLPYDADAWRTAHLLIRCHGPIEAMAAAQEMAAELSRQRHRAAPFWRLIVRTVEDWHSVVPRAGERFH